MTNRDNLQYDLVLVFTAFQRNCIYASIIKELASKYRIALFIAERDDQTKLRIGNTNNQFVEFCKSLGADLLSGESVSTKIVILAQSNYGQEDIEQIKASIHSMRTYWMSGVAMGNAFYDSLYGMKVDKVLVPDRRIYNYRVNEYSDDGISFEPSMIFEIGIPYSKYALLENTVEVDYILANPTPFSFVTPEDRYDYLKNVLHFLVENVRSNEVVAFKPHNADERADYIVNKHLNRLLSYRITEPFHVALDFMACKLTKLIRKGKIHDSLIEFSIAIIYQKVMKRVVKLSEITPFHNFNLEVFLPTTRKGLITGRSNSIWHGLFLKKPVWNCIDEEKPYFSETKMHKHTMRYLDVHGNYESADFDVSHYEVIEESTREADLIKLLDADLSELTASN